MENNTPQEQNAPAFDMDALSRMVAEQVRTTVDALAPEQPAADVVVNPGAKPSEKPEARVIAERCPAWKRHTAQVLTLHQKLVKADDAAVRFDLQRQINDLANTRSNAMDWQREEDDATRQIIDRSNLSGLAKERLHSTLTGPAGGFLLPKPFMAMVHVVIEEYGDARRLFTVVPMTSETLDLKNVASKPTATWTGQGANFTESDIAFGEQKLTAKKLAVITSWTTEQEQDQAIALLPNYALTVGESFSQSEDEAGFLGDGTSTYGGFTGLLKYSGVTTTTGATGVLAIGDITEAHVRALPKSLTAAGRRNARFLMHYDVWDHISQLENTAGFRVVQPNITAGIPASLLGYPVEIAEAMPNPAGDSASTELFAFGDFRRAYMGSRAGMSIDVSGDAVISNAAGAVTYNSFQADGQLMRMSERVGFQMPTAYQAYVAVFKTAAS